MITSPPPGLTCHRCEEPFQGKLALRTTSGWQHHGRCPGVRACSVADCDRKHKGHGYCQMHLKRYRKTGDPTQTLARFMPPETGSPLVIEDVEWMVETGEHVLGAAQRTGRSVAALEKALERAGRRDLYLALKSRVLVAA